MPKPLVYPEFVNPQDAQLMTRLTSVISAVVESMKKGKEVPSERKAITEFVLSLSGGYSPKEVKQLVNILME